MSRALATAFLGVPTSTGIVNMGQTMRKQLGAQAVLLARVTASARNTVSFHFPSFGQTFPFSHSVGVFFPLKNQGERTESPFSEGRGPHTGLQHLQVTRPRQGVDGVGAAVGRCEFQPSVS